MIIILLILCFLLYHQSFSFHASLYPSLNKTALHFYPAPHPTILSNLIYTSFYIHPFILNLILLFSGYLVLGLLSAVSLTLQVILVGLLASQAQYAPTSHAREGIEAWVQFVGGAQGAMAVLVGGMLGGTVVATSCCCKSPKDNVVGVYHPR